MTHGELSRQSLTFIYAGILLTQKPKETTFQLILFFLFGLIYNKLIYAVTFGTSYDRVDKTYLMVGQKGIADLELNKKKELFLIKTIPRHFAIQPVNVTK